MAASIHPAADTRDLHPKIASFLAKLNTLPPVDPSRVDVQTRRAAFASFAGGSNGESVFTPRIDDFMAELPAPCGSRHIRVYYPSRDSAKVFRCFLYLHGGGWHAGSITTHDAICRRLAVSSGCAIASLEYRLAPEAPAPAATEDCCAAYAWLAKSAATLQLDPRAIGMAGDSAGANIVAGAALELSARPRGDDLPAVRALALFYPSLDLTAGGRLNHAGNPSAAPFATATEPLSSYELFGEGFYLRTPAMIHYVSLYLGDRSSPAAILPTDPRVSPLLAPPALLAALPPTLIATAGFDPLRDEGALFARVLSDLGVPVSYVCHTGMIHVWMHLVAQVGEDVSSQLAELGARMARL